MAKRKRLTPAQALGTAPETKSTPMRPAPIAQVASDAASTHALQELTDLVSTARAEGRLIQPLPLDAIEPGHLVRDRLLDGQSEDMDALVESLRARGQQTPIDVVALDGGRFGLISGLRRYTGLRQIGAETVLARIVAPETATEAYVSMIEENEIRADLSLYERARIVAKAVEAGVFSDIRDALLTLYANTSRAKRSKIKTVIPVVEALDGVLRFPTALSERACLDLARALEDEAGLADRVRAQLAQTPPMEARTEAELLSRCRVRTPKPMPSPPVAQKPAKNMSPSDEIRSALGVKSDFSHNTQNNNTHKKSDSEVSQFPQAAATQPIAGVFVRTETSPDGQTRVILSGPNVSDALRDEIGQWLRRRGGTP